MAIDPNDLALQTPRRTFFMGGETGIVLSGGGSRAAYQIGVLKALIPYLEAGSNSVSVIVGSSIGAVNGIAIGGCLRSGLRAAVSEVEGMWRERNFRNTFSGSPSRAFLRAIKVAVVRYSSPGPSATSQSIFDPTPLATRLDGLIAKHGGLSLKDRTDQLKAIAVMTTLEGATRRPMLFVSSRDPYPEDTWKGATFEAVKVESLSAKHGLGSAALPSVLPAVELDVEGGRVRVVDGGISENIPVDPAVRLGAEKVIIVDISGRLWWFDRFGEPHDTRPKWEVPAGDSTYCVRPPDTLYIRNRQGFGSILRDTVSLSKKDFISALGPTWPIFTLLKRRMGEELAYEVMTYVALHPTYIGSLIDQGYADALEFLKTSGFAEPGQAAG